MSFLLHSVARDGSWYHYQSPDGQWCLFSKDGDRPCPLTDEERARDVTQYDGVLVGATLPSLVTLRIAARSRSAMLG